MFNVAHFLNFTGAPEAPVKSALSLSGVETILDPQLLPEESNLRVEPTKSRYDRMTYPVPNRNSE
jgi:hypothetical protein